MLLFEKIGKYRIILASSSPRRRELLKGCDIPFELAAPYSVDEVYPQGLEAEKVPQYLSGLKSAAYPEKLGHRDILLTADTVVIVGGEILGKPVSADDARRMLAKLSGRAHRVITGVTLRNPALTHGFSTCSSVRFRNLEPDEIDYYVDKYVPTDKAGSYGIQEWIGYVGIEGIEGSFYNVMGLPVQNLYAELGKFINKLE